MVGVYERTGKHDGQYSDNTFRVAAAIHAHYAAAPKELPSALRRP
jgi:hypothetical protein